MTQTKKRNLRIDTVIDYRLSHSYTETLQEFGLTPCKFFRVVKDAYAQGVVNQSRLEQCLIIERPTLDDYFNEVKSGERKRFPDGTHLSKANNVSLVEIVLEKLPVDEKYPGYAAATREQKIELIRKHVINYKSQTPDADNGARQFFYDNGLAGLMSASPHLRKINSPRVLMELYDKERKIGLFDRTQKEYLGRWEITENGMWQGDSNKQFAVEVIEDVLWHIPGYRDATREEKIRLIREHIIGYKAKDPNSQNGPLQFFYDNGLKGLMNSSAHLRKKCSPRALMELYDRERKSGLFDKSKDDYLEMRERSDDGNGA
ncbi:hypothetical protein HYU06_06285 [Candidatus Woesearchaeota archaeon]|nr:hypothetical protein [Candidatus Woesearchaeota archaeon]